MELHLNYVFQETDKGEDKDIIAFHNFVEYGRRFLNLPVEGTGKLVKEFEK